MRGGATLGGGTYAPSRTARRPAPAPAPARTSSPALTKWMKPAFVYHLRRRAG